MLRVASFWATQPTPPVDDTTTLLKLSTTTPTPPQSAKGDALASRAASEAAASRAAVMIIFERMLSSPRGAQLNFFFKQFQCQRKLQIESIVSQTGVVFV